MQLEEIIIEGDFITLSQLLKLTNMFESGGHIKNYIQDVGVYVNDELEHRRGKKIYHNDIVEVQDEATFKVITKNS